MSTPEPPPFPGGSNDDDIPSGQVPPPPGFPPPPPQPGVPSYGQYGQGPVPPAALPGSSKATTSLVFGIIGLVCCGAIGGIVAIITGKQATAEAAAAGYPQPGNAKAGIILGWIAVAWTVVVVLGWILLAVIGFAGSSMTPPSVP